MNDQAVGKLVVEPHPGSHSIMSSGPTHSSCTAPRSARQPPCQRLIHGLYRTVAPKKRERSTNSSGVRVERSAPPAGEPRQRQAAVVGQLHGERRGGAHPHEDRGACCAPPSGRARRPAARARRANRLGEGQPALQQRRPTTLSMGIVAADVLAKRGSSPAASNRPAAWEAAGPRERGLAQAVGQRGEQRGARSWVRPPRAGRCASTSLRAPLPQIPHDEVV